MDNVFFMCRLYSFGDLYSNVQHPPYSPLAKGGDRGVFYSIFQMFSSDIFHHQKQIFVCLLDGMDGGNIGMIQGSGGFGFVMPGSTVTIKDS